MIFLYLLALIPLLIGGIFWLFSKKVCWQEWAISSLSAFLISGIMHFAAIYGQTADIQTYSGLITKAVFYPEWVEEYQEMHTRQVYSGTDSKGNAQYSTEIYYTTEYRTHSEHWTAYSNIDTNYEITLQKFDEMRVNFENFETQDGHKSGFYSGDKNIYVTNRKTSFVYPITDLRSWSNKVKAAPSAFSFPTVPPDIDKKLYDWPENGNPWSSNRLLGTHIEITPDEWDKLNAKLGPSKHVNLILIGFGNQDESISEWQRAKWINGKKNDVILTFGTDKEGKVTWVNVFGWTESEIVKSNLKTILLDSGKVDNAILPKIEAEILKNYKMKDWSKFDYLTVEPLPRHYFICFGVMLITQIGFWIWAYCNDIDKTSQFNRNRNYSNRWRY